MEKKEIKINNTLIPVYSVNTLIIGSGVASLNAALSLFKKDVKDIAITTDNWGGGTSNNAGSDKQTYYKLSVEGKIHDSPYSMAKDLFSGGCMHGDIALCEAQHSLQAFYNLFDMGVTFPHDPFGAFPGYKTDHDQKGRATSAGPLTSRLMFEVLAGEIKKNEIPVFDKHEIISLIVKTQGRDKHVIGAIAIDKKNVSDNNLGFVIFNAVNIILGTGGPGGLYKNSVYPESQTGSTGLALRVGATAQNLTESQFGLASINPRWNLSGTYQQVIPSYISTDINGNNKEEFLNDYFPDIKTLTTAIFLKGYQWPFDPRKIINYGSSLIDILVYRETVIRERRVFLDYANNPSYPGTQKEYFFDQLEDEPREYLNKSGALFGAPVDRLEKMNPLALDLYKSFNIDISKELLEIAVCAQHNNGGLKGNIWWESNIKHLFPVGEVNGTHGVYRPGGTALNAGQVGGIRAAMYIAGNYSAKPPAVNDFFNLAENRIDSLFEFANKMISPNVEDKLYLSGSREQIQKRMSQIAAFIRDPEEITRATGKAWEMYSELNKNIRINSSYNLPEAFKNMDLCFTHAIYLEAIKEYLNKGGKSRGAYLVLDQKGIKPCDNLEEEYKFSLSGEDDYVNQKILEITMDEKNLINKNWVDIRPVPEKELWFENVWKEFRNNNIIK